MRQRPTALCITLLVPLANQADAQSTLIHGTTPPAVVERLKAQLLPTGFNLEHADNKSALFTLDRGTVVQQGGPIPFVHVVIETVFRFKAKPDGLSVTADETVVGERGRPMEFRRRVESLKERDNLQALLDSVRIELEGPTGPSPSAVKADSAAP